MVQAVNRWCKSSIAFIFTSYTPPFRIIIIICDLCRHDWNANSGTYRVFVPHTRPHTCFDSLLKSNTITSWHHDHDIHDPIFYQNSVDDAYSLFKYLCVVPYSERRIWNKIIKKPIQKKSEAGFERLKKLLGIYTLRRLKSDHINGASVSQSFLQINVCVCFFFETGILGNWMEAVSQLLYSFSRSWRFQRRRKPLNGWNLMKMRTNCV